MLGFAEQEQARRASKRSQVLGLRRARYASKSKTSGYSAYGLGRAAGAVLRNPKSYALALAMR